MALTITTPAGSRATRITQDTVDGAATSTHWNISSDLDGSYIVETTPSGSTSGNVLDGDLSFIDIWLPPSHEYSVRTRHGTAAAHTAWTAAQTFTSRGPLNSYEKYQALNGTSGVDNIDVIED